MEDIKNQTFYRRLFFEHIENHMNFLNGPGGTTTTMEKLFGSEGTKLYCLALEEEVDSWNFIQAVLANSITEYPGERWGKKLVEIIGGPSGIGKTTAAKSVTEKAKKFMQEETITDPSHINYIISIDGGTVRLTSQIRKLAILLAYYLNYIGIRDLEDYSAKLLETVKNQIKNWVLHEDNPHSVIIPETFSTAIWPFTPSLLSEIAQLKNNPLFIFCEIKGEDPKKTKEVVNAMGENRAYDKNVQANQDIDFDLNKTDTTKESKAYNPKWYDRGIDGTAYAAKIFKSSMFPDGIYMQATSDLFLHDVEDANKKEKVIISARALEDYKKTSEEQQKSGETITPIKDFIEATKDNYPPIIMTTASLQIKDIEHDLTQYYHSLNKKTECKTIEFTTTTELFIKLQLIKNYLEDPEKAINDIAISRNTIIVAKNESTNEKFVKLLIKLETTLNTVSDELNKITKVSKVKEEVQIISSTVNIYPTATTTASQ